MRTPRRWMVLWAAIALMFIALLPTEGAAGGKIKFITPPGDEYFGDPDMPGGGSPAKSLEIAPVLLRLRLVFQAPFGLIVVPISLPATQTGKPPSGCVRTRVRND